MTRIVLSHGEPATEVGKNALSDLRKKYSTKDVTFTSINLGKSKEEVYNTLKQFENEPVEVLSMLYTLVRKFLYNVLCSGLWLCAAPITAFYH